MTVAAGGYRPAIATTASIRTLEDVPGWFYRTDQLVMDRLLRHQAEAGIAGDLLELGAYLGKSTVLIGLHRREDERFVVCDLFGAEPPTEENRAIASIGYTGALNQAAFEANYAAFHSRPPDVVQGPSTAARVHVAPGSTRFVHIDASHLYDNVLEDIETARSVLVPDGIVVFDDYRAAHTPGVPAAVWPLVAAGEVRVICATPNKLYATWGDAAPAQRALVEWLGADPAARFTQQTVAGQAIVLVQHWPPRRRPPSPVPRARNAPPERLRVPPGARRLAEDVLPPVVSRAMRRRRAPG